MIYTVTFNPSLDYIMHVENFNYGSTNRSSTEKIYPGGKGFNVATILHRLNLPTTALGFIAGFTGAKIKELLQSRGFKCDLIELKQGISRINVKMKSDQETEINGSGPVISSDEVALLFDKLKQLTTGDILVLAGSIPNSLPDDIYQQILALVNRDVLTIVDAVDDLLLKVLPYHPFLIKPNHQELQQIFKTTIKTKKDIIHYATRLQKSGARNVLVSLGKDGAILVCEDNNSYYCPGAKGQLINSVGSGDSMVAGFIAGYLQDGNYQAALKLGSACGGATAFSEDLATASLIEEIKQQLEVIKI